jgi:hypothetical protein
MKRKINTVRHSIFNLEQTIYTLDLLTVKRITKFPPLFCLRVIIVEADMLFSVGFTPSLSIYEQYNKFRRSSLYGNILFKTIQVEGRTGIHGGSFIIVPNNSITLERFLISISKNFVQPMYISEI